MTYIQHTLVNAIHDAEFCGRTSRDYAGRGLSDLACMWATWACTSARVALIILEHELTDDVLRDDRGIE